MARDPREILAESPMSGFQVVAVGVCIFLNALDGFDVLAISFASPGIAGDWAISRAELGVVLSMELIGMAIGSIALGGLADRFGRRPTIIACLTVMAIGMYLASLVTSVNQLLAVRFITGLGIGGMLAAISAMTSEFSNKKNKNLAVMWMAAGYPAGAVLGGAVASQLLVHYDWRAVFVFGAAATVVALVLAILVLPESIAYLMEKRPANVLEKVNRTLQRMGHDALATLPEPEQRQTTGGFAQIFKPELAKITACLTAAYFFHVMAFYYIIKWIPKIVVDMDYAASEAGNVLVWANVGGALGAIVVGFIATKLDIRKVMIAVMVISFGMITFFGLGQNNLSQLALVSAVTGFFTNSGIVGLYAMFTQYFPSKVRASGIGFAIGVGRGGAALGPIVAGILFEQGLSLFIVSVLMGASALLAAVFLLPLKKMKAG